MNGRVVLKPVRVSSRQPEPPRRKRKKNNLWKGILVVLFSTGLTTLAINASDSFKNPGSLLAGVGGTESKVKAHCPSDMAYITTADSGFCIDKYEVSAGETCQYSDPKNGFDTNADLTDPKCFPVVKKGNRPWVNVPLHQALAVCAKVGKRLPTNKEWYSASLGTPDAVSPDGASACVIGRTGQSRSEPTGSRDQCVSSYGVTDMVGNVWEWVDGQVEDGKYGSRYLSSEGYVDEVDVDGVPTKTATTSNLAFGEDYLFIDHAGIKGMIRGGFWSLKEKAGIFAINATIPTSFVGDAVGFRCAKDSQ